MVDCVPASPTRLDVGFSSLVARVAVPQLVFGVFFFFPEKIVPYVAVESMCLRRRCVQDFPTWSL